MRQLSARASILDMIEKINELVRKFNDLEQRRLEK